MMLFYTQKTSSSVRLFFLHVYMFLFHISFCDVFVGHHCFGV